MYVTSTNSFSEALQLPAITLATEPRADNCQIKLLKPRQVLFAEGLKSDCVYQIVSGVVRTSKVLYNGRRQVLAFGYPGDFVGLSHDRLYHSDCEAITDAKVRIIRKNACSINFDYDSDLSDELLKYAASEVTSMQEHFLMLGQKSAVEKIASFLVSLANRVGEKGEGEICFDLPMSRTDIADFLGLTIETVSRTLTKLRNQKLITLPNPHSVCIANMSALMELADSED